MDIQVTRQDLEIDKDALLNAANIHLIFECFKTTVEIGPVNKNKRILTLTGRRLDIEKAKKYIFGSLSPEVTISISLSKAVGEKVRLRTFSLEFITQYPIAFEIRNDNKLTLKGQRADVYAAEKYFKALEKQLSGTIKMDCDSDENDGSIICLSDPYEAFADDDVGDDDKSKKKEDTSTKKPPASKLDSIDDSVIWIDDNRSLFSNAAIAQGFTSRQTDQACNELQDKVNSMNESQFIQYMKNKFKNDMRTVSDMDLCIKPEETNKKSTATNKQFQQLQQQQQQQQQQTSTPISNKQLNEYVKMMETQKFDPKHEEENKLGRITALIQAMDSKQAKVDALGQVFKYKEAASNREHKRSTTTTTKGASSLLTDEDESVAASNSLLDYTAMMIDEGESVASKSASKSTDKFAKQPGDVSILPGYETMMMDEEDISITTPMPTTMSKTPKNNENNKPIAVIKSSSSSSKKAQLDEAKMKKSITSELISSTGSNKTKTTPTASQPTPIQCNSEPKSKDQKSGKFRFKSVDRNENSNNRGDNQNKNNNNNNMTTTASAFVNKSSQEDDADVTEIKELDMAMKELSNRQDLNDPLRYIIIDGSNVAMEHGIQTNGGQQAFSCAGIRIVVDYFMKRGHKNVKAFVPRFRRGTSDKKCPTLRGEILDELEKRNHLIYTPSRYVGNQLICPYDDRFILRAAQHYNAVIVSNDNYRDLRKENAEWDQLVKYNLLQYSFLGDLFMIADDPMGRNGPTIDEFLSNSNKTNKGSQQQQQQRNQFHSVSSSGQLKTSSFGHHFNSSNNFKSSDWYKSNNNNNNRNGLSKMGSWSNLIESNQQNRSSWNNKQQQHQATNYSSNWPLLRDLSPRSRRSANSSKQHHHQQQQQQQPRNMAETGTLYSKLLDIFPKSDNRIKQLLLAHSDERDVMFFANKILEGNLTSNP